MNLVEATTAETQNKKAIETQKRTTPVAKQMEL